MNKAVIAIMAFLLAFPAFARHAPGNASVYGVGGDGNCGTLTASGERFDCHALTAAHKTLPLGTFVSVCHRESKKCVMVRVNDRGPYVPSREIDLSPLAATAIACDGLCFVDLKVVSEPPAKIASTIHEKPAAHRLHHRHHHLVGTSGHQRADQSVLPGRRKAVPRSARRPHERVAEGARHRLPVAERP